jgi:hypothetical protein
MLPHSRAPFITVIVFVLEPRYYQMEEREHPPFVARGEVRRATRRIEIAKERPAGP